MTYEITRLEEPARHLAVTRFVARPDEIGGHIGGAFGTVAAHLGRLGITPVGAAVACYRMGGPAFEVRAGFEVDEPVEPQGSIEPWVLPAGDALTTVHVGPYEELTKAYEALEARARELGVTLDPATMWEEYMSGPEVPPEQMRTVIHWPLAG
jgi:effector-binding domain-containing protein